MSKPKVETAFDRERKAMSDEIRKLRSRLKATGAELASVHKSNDTAAEIRAKVYELGEMLPDPPAWVSAPSSDVGYSQSVPVAMWSDWHWGETVRPEEVGGANEFNRTIAKARLQRLVDSTISIAKNYIGAVKLPGIVVCLGGDMISGNIHEELRETNEGAIQQSILEVQDQIASALTKMADEFGKVFVPCVVGNHGRMTRKPPMKHRAFESFEWNIYQQLERYFRNDPRFQFMIPDGADALFSVYGHRFLLTHGDALGVKGGDGIIGALGPITRGAVKVGRSEAQIGRDFDTILMGHWHMYTPRGEGAPVVVNGTLKGYDEYARLGLRVPFSRPSQALFFVHPKFGITSQWPIYLDAKGSSRRPDAEWLKFANV